MPHPPPGGAACCAVLPVHTAAGARLGLQGGAPPRANLRCSIWNNADMDLCTENLPRRTRAAGETAGHIYCQHLRQLLAGVFHLPVAPHERSPARGANRACLLPSACVDVRCSPPAKRAPPPQVSLGNLPGYMFDGLDCLLGAYGWPAAYIGAPSHPTCDSAGPLKADIAEPRRAVCNLALNVSALHLLQRSSAVVASLVSSIAVRPHPPCLCAQPSP